MANMFSSIVSALTASGLTASSAFSAAKGIFGGNAAKNTLTGLVQAAALNESNPAALTQIVTNIQVTPGVPQIIVNLANNLKSGGDPMAFVQVIDELETQIALL